MTTDAAPRLFAVGASNLARLALALLDAARRRAGGPVVMHAALGRGRSYGMPSRLLGRGLDGILASALWRQLPDGDAAATTGLLMDVGNDLLYGVEVPRILDWAGSALERLRRHAARVVVVGLPTDAVAGLSRWRFALVRSVLAPGCRLTLPDAVAGAGALDRGLAGLAAECGAEFHAPNPHWYGFDPVHVRRRFYGEAAATWLGAGAAPAVGIDTAARRLGFLFARPAARRWFGVPWSAAQPCRRYVDGSAIHLW